MKGGVRLSIAGMTALLALAGCGRGFLDYGERAPWRHQAEVACLKSGEVKVGAGVVQIQPIEGPGVCGADFPLKVAALGESSPAIGYADDLRPPAGIPNAASAQMPRWPVNQTRYMPPPRVAPVQVESVQAPPIQGQTMRWVPGPPGIESSPGPAPAGQPMSISPPGLASPAEMRRGMPNDIPDAAILPPEQAQPAYPRPQRAYNAPAYEPPQPRAVPPLGPNTMAANMPAALTPPATLACPIVSALDRWVSEGVQPAALHWFGAPVVKIQQISAYSCREMVGAGTSHISEHAFGNALDIAGFTLADGRKITVKDGWHGTAEEQGFLHDVQLYACETFTTVLAPGYNVYHYNHIHVDLMRRRPGYRPCRPTAIPGEAVAARVRAHYAGLHRGPAYTGSIAAQTSDSLPEAPAGEDGYVADDDDDSGATGSIPEPAAKPNKSGFFGDAIAHLLGRSSQPARQGAVHTDDGITRSY